MNSKYRIDSKENKVFLEEIRNRLFEFGRKFPSPGGGAYYLGDDGTPWKDRSRETWITSRMVHVYSLAKFLGFAGSDELIDAGLKGLLGELKDKENGSWFHQMNEKNEVIGTVWPGKSDLYHAVQATLIPYYAVECSIAPAVKKS